MREVFVEIPNVSWNDVGALDDIKQELIEALEWPLRPAKDIIRNIDKEKQICIFRWRVKRQGLVGKGLKAD